MSRYPLDHRYKESVRKRNHAKQIFKERRVCKEVRDAILMQIEVCEDLCCPVNETQIEEWCMCKNAIQVERKAHAIKFA